MSLSHVKGSPPTFDASKLSADLVALQDLSRSASLPIYDRDLHEPVEGTPPWRTLFSLSLPFYFLPELLNWSLNDALGAVSVAAEESPVIVVEGLFLLRPDPSFLSVKSQLDYVLLLLIPVDLSRERLIERKLKTGRTREAAEAAFERVDRVNHERAEDEKRFANLTLRLDVPGNSLSKVVVPKDLL